jgi:predicted Zn finger-like uncharacterized protein
MAALNEDVEVYVETRWKTGMLVQGLRAARCEALSLCGCTQISKEIKEEAMNKFQPKQDGEFSICRDVPLGVPGESVVFKAVGVCPYCNTANTVQKSSSGVDRFGLQSIRCTHCSKNWSERLAGSLAKSAGSTGLAELQVQVRGQIDELVKRIDGILQQRATPTAKPSRFQTDGVAKTDVASRELEKALANGKPARWD